MPPCVLSTFVSYSTFCPYSFVVTQAPLPSMGGKEDEVAAMAAMFQAQSANWEETQEKMSQLVSPLALLPVSCSKFSNTNSLSRSIAGYFAFSLSLPSAKPGFTPTHVERGSVVVASRLCHTINNRPTGRCRPATYATVVGRKVCAALVPYPMRVYLTLGARPLDTRLPDE